MSDLLNRREFLQQLGTIGAGAAIAPGLGGMLSSASASDDRPNIVFILTDDQRWDAMSCMGHPFVKTPNMDRIAAEGVRFDNAFVTISLCSPSRACFLTGLYAHSHGVRNNRTLLDRSHATFPRLLQNAGYDTAFVGKWHMGSSSDDPRPGFDYWLSFRGQGRYNNPDLNENGRAFKAEGYMTDLLTDYAVKWLRQSRDAPFCLYLSHKAVHGPFTPAERHRDLYADVQMVKPESYDDTFAGKPEWQRVAAMRRSRRDRRSIPPEEIPPSIPPAEWNPRSASRLNYYRSLIAVDEGVGKVLQTLEDLGVLDSTVVVFAGDNGYFHGEHRRGDKRLAYEESIRIPLLMRYPKLAKPGTTTDEMVLNIDLAPTFLDLAGVQIPDEIQGTSLRPLFAGQLTQWRRSFLYEYFEERQYPIPTVLGVRTERWKYVTHPEINDLDELYDLETDPHELHNLARNPDYADRCKEMQAELERLLTETGYHAAEARKVEAQKSILNRKPELVLHYSFGQGEVSRAVDLSGKGNHGTIKGAKPTDGGLQFDGKSWIEIENSASLNPAMKPWSVAARVKADKPHGVILARGGQSHGYSLYLEDGIPKFAARLPDGLHVVSAREKVTGDWAHLVGAIGGMVYKGRIIYRLRIYVNGKLRRSTEIPGYIGRDPSDNAQIGMDRGSVVGDYKGPFGFSGIISEIKTYVGELRTDQIKS